VGEMRPAPDEILWDQATINVGLTDPKGVARTIELSWNGQPQQFVPGVAHTGLFSTGVHAPAPGVSDRAGALRFDLALDVKGTRELRFVPGGNETTVQLTSPWPHPSFLGLPPETPRVEAGGFAASWRVPYFGRGFAPMWKSGDASDGEQLSRLADASSFGVALVQPVDIYVQTDRALKYAVLFIVMTFAISFLLEIAGGALVHPIQYMFVGFALCMFYLLLLSIAEHRGFDIAYAAAATVTIVLLAWYWSWVLNGRRRGFMMGASLTALYGYLYLLLRLEDYALLAGSLGLFAMLALVMFLTRRVDWYRLKLGNAE
jgi:inner membrane protein